MEEAELSSIKFAGNGGTGGGDWEDPRPIWTDLDRKVLGSRAQQVHRIPSVVYRRAHCWDDCTTDRGPDQAEVHHTLRTLD